MGMIGKGDFTYYTEIINTGAYASGPSQLLILIYKTV